MNRKDFLIKASVALGGFSILPAAKTYDRIWEFKRKQGWERVTFKNGSSIYWRKVTLGNPYTSISTEWKCEIRELNHLYIDS